MVKIEFSESRHVAIVTPERDLTVDDIQTISKTIDAHINTHDIVPNLVLCATHLPHWDSFSAMKQHFKLVRDHHKLIRKVAVVSDDFAMKALPYLMDHFVKAKVRHFSGSRMQAAIDWAESGEDHPGAFDLLDDLPDDVVGIKARGIITSQDYTGNLIPLIEGKLQKHDKLKLLMIFDDEFDSCSEGAAWDDMRFGFSHIGDFSKIAIVSNKDWIRHSMKLFAPLIRSEVNLFDVADLAQARAWIKS